jgi:transmembrane sensor
MGEAVKNDPAELRRLTEAAAWRAALSDAGVDSSAEFDLWLAADPANRKAWQSVQTGWDLVGRQAASPAMLEARREALAWARQGRYRSGRRRYLAAAAVVAICLLGASAWFAFRPDVYQTALAEQRSILLADGSRVTLDADTKVEVRLTSEARRLTLLRGQARFDVAHDVTRPFSVQVGDETVVATGTSFNIDLLGGVSTVTLIEGRLSILDNRRQASMVAGERLRRPAVETGKAVEAAPPAVEAIDKEELSRASAWESGQLFFDDEPLSSVAQRISRYTAHPVIAAGPAAELRLSGVFNISDAAGFAETVQQSLSVQVERRPDGTVVLTKKKFGGISAR